MNVMSFELRTIQKAVGPSSNW